MSDQLFDLTLTEEQRITREAMARFAEQEISSIARAADEAAAAPEGFFEKTTELGLTILPIPEEYGGAGAPRSPIANMLNAEDLGKGDMSLAIGMLTPLAFVNALLDFGNEDQQERYLTPLASESFQAATIALMEPKATFNPKSLDTKAEKQGSGYVLNGTKSMVALGASSQFILVVADTEDEGPCGFVVEAGCEGLRIEQSSFMGLRALELNQVVLENVLVSASAKLGSPEKPFDLQRLLDLSSLGLCALAVGCGQAVLDYVTPYVNERIAFGEPISNRQSVAFMVANIAIELDAMRMMVYRAASKAEQGLGFHREAYQAQIICAQRSMEIGTNGLQLLGGHGFTREYPVEMWYRNLRAVGILQGAVMV
ncbi:MAG: acyl-CoA dehydrogenase family protein [Pseudomonadales bacterium]|nr:acyl-CoA dehydrogenase family protein [Pseudomonadales bacterium]